MESGGRRRRSGLKGKLVMSFYKAPKPSPAQYSGKVKPAPASTASMGYVAAEDQFPMVPSPLPPAPREKVRAPRSETKRDCGGGYVDDGEENVDRLAANYISMMQERFRLEQND